MHTLESSPPVTRSVSTTSALTASLLELQLRVARYADALARRRGAERSSDRQLWLRAEQEVFSLVEFDARSRFDSTSEA